MATMSNKIHISKDLALPAEDHPKINWNDPQERKLYQKQWRETNRERLKKEDHEYYLANREHFREQSHQNYLQNKERYIERSRRFKQENRTKWLEYQRRYRELHPEQARTLYMRTRALVIEKLGGKCIRCGFSDKRALQIDHINGGGLREQKLIQTSGIHRKILHGSDGYQLLCANCNSIKRWERPGKEGVGARP